MYYDSSQFGSFDGLDNRKSIMDLFVRMGHGVPDYIARIRRKIVLERLLTLSENGFADKMVQIQACDPVEAYNAFVAITGVLGVPVEKAAKTIEEMIRHDGCHSIFGP